MRGSARIVVMLILAGAWLCAGCARSGEPQRGAIPRPRGALLRESDTYWPATNGALWFDLEIGGIVHTVRQEVKTDAGTHETTVELHSGEQTLVERYAVDELGVSFVGAGGDRFTPPIRLIEYGREAGETCVWGGTNQTEGETPLHAEARVSTSAELTRLPIGTLSTVRATVSMVMPGSKMTQDMVFWFAPGEGLVKASLCGYTRAVRNPPPGRR
jgi:hypothetical protein